MSDHNEFRAYVAEKKIGEDVHVQFLQPIPMPPQTPGGQPSVAFADKGKLLAVFTDGLLIRAERAERFYAWKNLSLIDFPSAVVAGSGLAL